MLGLLLRTVVGLLMLASTATLASAEKRVALVIGNGAYQNVARLANPVNDAGDMRAKLTSLGFELFGGADLDRAGMLRALLAFGRSAENADVALVFYAGHGMQVNGQNYLVPIDAQVEYEQELDISLVPFQVVMQQLSRGSRVNIALLDACRDNPFQQNLSRSMGTRAVSALGRGLSRVRSATGTFIAYATEPDNVAQDGSGRNSPFTTALLRNIDRPGLSLSDLMIDVRNEVIQLTNGKQVPWDTSSLTGRFTFRIEGTITITPDKQTGSASTTPPLDRNALELGVWTAIQNSSDAATFEKFLADFPNGVFSAAARERLSRLKSPPVASLPTAREIDACDRLAAAPDDPDLPSGASGVDLGDIDPTKAVAACRRALSANASSRRFALALGRALYRSGSLVEAARQFRAAAEGGSAPAMANLGVVLEFGQGVQADAVEALRWHKAAADAGNAAGMLNYGLALHTGLASAPDPAAGQQWLKRAAEKGNVSALLIQQPANSRGAPQVIENGNIYAVLNRPRLPAEFTLDQRFLLASMFTYHWNNQRGSRPGRIGLRHEGGQTFGPWQSKGKPGQGGVPNAYWSVDVPVVLPPGTYTVLDSEPATWATNAGNGYRGFFQIQGWRLQSLN